MKKFLVFLFLASGTSYFAQQDKVFTYVITLNNTVISSSQKSLNIAPEKIFQEYFTVPITVSLLSGVYTINTKSEMIPYDFAVLMESKGLLVASIEKQIDSGEENNKRAIFYYKPLNRDPQRVKP